MVRIRGCVPVDRFSYPLLRPDSELQQLSRNRRPARVWAWRWHPAMMGRSCPCLRGFRCAAVSGCHTDLALIRTNIRVRALRTCGRPCVSVPEENQTPETNVVLEVEPDRSPRRAGRMPRNQLTFGERRAATNRPSSTSLPVSLFKEDSLDLQRVRVMCRTSELAISRA